MGRKFERKSLLFSERTSYKSIGYARQGSQEQISLAAQIEELKNSGCFIIFVETIKSSSTDRPKLKEALGTLREGDEICFTKLHRGFSTQRNCIKTINDLLGKGIHVRTTDGLINTRVLGKLAPIAFGLLSGLSEIEHHTVIERVQKSIKSRRETGGNLGGRPKTNNEKEVLVLRLRNEGCSYRLIRKQTGLALSTIRRIIVEGNASKS